MILVIVSFFKGNRKSL